MAHRELATPKRLKGIKGIAHNRSPKQEAERAAQLGGKTTKGSGNGFEKGDVRFKDVVRLEQKTTTAKSFRVTRDMLDKIETEAVSCGEMPVFEIEFLSEKGQVEGKLYVVPDYVLQELVDKEL